MHLFKHSIRFIETRPVEMEISFSNIETARHQEHEYRVRKKEVLNESESHLLLWFERVSNGLKEGEKYYWEDSRTKEKQEISQDEYESLKREYNYFLVFDKLNNSIFSYNTSDSQKNIVHKNLIKKFLKIKDFKIYDTVDFEELKEYFFTTMKLRYKNTKQTGFSSIMGKNILEDLKNDFSSEFDFNELDIIFKSKRNIIKNENGYKRFLEKIVNDDVDFMLDGVDKYNNPIKIENQKMQKKLEISKTKADHTNPNNIYESIKEYFTEVENE